MFLVTGMRSFFLYGNVPVSDYFHCVIRCDDLCWLDFGPILFLLYILKLLFALTFCLTLKPFPLPLTGQDLLQGCEWLQYPVFLTCCL